MTIFFFYSEAFVLSGYVVHHLLEFAVNEASEMVTHLGYSVQVLYVLSLYLAPLEVKFGLFYGLWLILA
jgi:hypothetical protein